MCEAPAVFLKAATQIEDLGSHSVKTGVVLSCFGTVRLLASTDDPTRCQKEEIRHWICSYILCVLQVSVITCTLTF